MMVFCVCMYETVRLIFVFIGGQNVAFSMLYLCKLSFSILTCDSEATMFTVFKWSWHEWIKILDTIMNSCGSTFIEICVLSV